jgi:hypothetical protein
LFAIASHLDPLPRRERGGIGRLKVPKGDKNYMSLLTTKGE